MTAIEFLRRYRPGSLVKSSARGEYQLAEHSGLTQSTISSWYRKQMLPTIPSLVKICDAFGITVSQFFLDDEEQAIHLTEKQSALLAASSKLNPEQYSALLTFLERL